MFLILSSQQDDCATRTYAELRKRGHGVLLIDDALSTSDLEMNWRADSDDPSGGWFGVAGQHLPLADIQGVLLRLLTPLREEPKQDLSDRRYVMVELAAALESLLHSLPARVVNRPVPGLSGRHIYARHGGAESVARAGFEVPDFCVATAPGRLCEMVRESNQPKAIVAGLHAPIAPMLVRATGVNAAVEELSAGHPIAPLYAQPIPRGEFVQIFLVGDRAFGVTGPPSGTRGNCGDQGSKRFLHRETVDKARALTNHWGLEFAQISVVETPNEGAYCLDMIEFPIYNHCEPNVQAGITSELASLLESRAEVPA